MLSSVLRGKRATMVNVEIMRAFVGLREALATHAALFESSIRWNRNSTASFASCSTPSAV
jgi:hypothetical protein